MSLGSDSDHPHFQRHWGRIFLAPLFQLLGAPAHVMEAVVPLSADVYQDGPGPFTNTDCNVSEIQPDHPGLRVSSLLRVTCRERSIFILHGWAPSLMGHYSRQGSLLAAEGNPNEKMHLWGIERRTSRYFWPGGHKMWWDWKRDHRHWGEVADTSD